VFTASQCKKPVINTNNNNTNTNNNNNHNTKDTSGQTLYITVKTGITASARPIEGARVYLFNNYFDFQKYDNTGVLTTNKSRYRYRVSDVIGECKMDTVR